MSFKQIIRTLILLSIFSIAACAYDFHHILHDAGEDDVYAFGVLPEKIDNFQAGTLMMMGNKYWYVLQHNDAKTFSDILNSGLNQRYRIFNEENEQELPYMPINIASPTQNIEKTRFDSSFCLRYQTSNQTEITKLTALSFTPLADKQDEYSRCLTARGEVYGSPKNVAEQYRFKQSIPVKLSYREIKKEISAVETLKGIGIIPVAVVGGVLSIPVWTAVAIGESRNH